PPHVPPPPRPPPPRGGGGGASMTSSSRREFLGIVGGGAVTALGGITGLSGCGQRASAKGIAVGAKETAARLPDYRPIDLVPPDIPGEGPIPNGYLQYPKHMTRLIHEKPGRGSRPRAIKT